MPPVLDGHEKIQRRVASAGQSWVRAIGNSLQTEGLLDMEFSASGLVEIANHANEDASVKIPGIKPEAAVDEKTQRVGIIMKQIFKNGSVAEIDMFKITRIEREQERPEHRDTRVRKFYVFSQNDQNDNEYLY